MDCPACNEPLAALEFDGVEVDHCAACGGVWLDEDEAALLLCSRAAVADFLAGLADSAGEPQRKLRCPVSGVPMRKAAIGEAGAVTVDVSPHGIWFDRGELAAVLSQGELPPRLASVAQWLREVFGANVSDG
jgi:Zn-finger nucleic acid-binding protein